MNTITTEIAELCNLWAHLNDWHRARLALAVGWALLPTKPLSFPGCLWLAARLAARHLVDSGRDVVLDWRDLLLFKR